jgi:hypothetical protein
MVKVSKLRKSYQVGGALGAHCRVQHTGSLLRSLEFSIKTSHLSTNGWSFMQLWQRLLCLNGRAQSPLPQTSTTRGLWTGVQAGQFLSGDWRRTSHNHSSCSWRWRQDWFFGGCSQQHGQRAARGITSKSTTPDYGSLCN